MKSPAKVQWEEAMLLELASHEANHSFEPATLPPGKHALGMRWVFKVKYDDSATEATRRVARYKARLVIQGHTQVQGVDFEESYSPVIAKEVLRIMLTIGAVLDYEIDAMDVPTTIEIPASFIELITWTISRVLCVHGDGSLAVVT